MNEIYSRSQISLAYFPLSEFAFIRLKAAIAFIRTGMASVVIVRLIAFVAPVLSVE